MKDSYFQFCAALAFVRFIDSEGLFPNYVSYLHGRHGKSVPDFLYRTDPANYISGAFVFADTPEGYDFWLDLFNRWNKILSHSTF